MKIFSRLRDDRYCAFCKSPRRMYMKKHVDLTNVVGLIALSLILTQAYYGQPDPRGAVLFVLFTILAEVFVYLRWRTAIVCRMCGFDPVVYKRSPERAANLVNQFFREQAENPEFWLSRSPLLEVHRRLREQERTRQEIEAMLGHKRSKSVATPPAIR